MLLNIYIMSIKFYSSSISPVEKLLNRAQRKINCKKRIFGMITSRILRKITYYRSKKVCLALNKL